MAFNVENYFFDDEFVDFLATTGINYNGAKQKLMSKYGGWSKQSGGKNYFQFQKHIDSGPDAGNWASDMFGSGSTYTDGVFAGDFIPNLQARFSLDVSQRNLINRNAQASDTYASYLADSRDSNLLYDELAFELDSRDESFLSNQDKILSARTGMSNNTTTSSVGAYSQAARAQIQSTQKYLNNLSRFSAPEEQEVIGTFKNPITGEATRLDATFDPASVYNAFSTVEDTRAFVDKQFNTRRDELVDTLWAKMADSIGFTGDAGALRNTGSEIGLALTRAGELYDGLKEQSASIYNSGSPNGASWRRDQWEQDNGLSAYNVLGDTGFTVKAYEDLKGVMGSFDTVYKFAEARSLAEMGNFQQGFSADTYQGENTALTGTQAVMRMLGTYKTNDQSQDWSADGINKLLGDTAQDTFSRFEIAHLTETQNIMDEFNRRQSMAEGRATSTTMRNKLNKQRTIAIQTQKQNAAQQLEAQIREYQQALSGAGASDTLNDGNITFSAIRPE